VPLPKHLKPIHIARAVEYVETQTAELIDIYLEQANVFSANRWHLRASRGFTRSALQKHKHPDIAQQRFRICR
jgi:hypothetical protein